MVDTIIASYNFESDNEIHINGEELSDLSDEFDDENDTLESTSQKSSTLSHRSKDLNQSSLLAIDDIPYDRDLKWINVPTNARAQKPQQHTLFNPNQNRILKQVSEIAKANMSELKGLDEHYRKLDERKKFSDEKFMKSYQDRKNRSTKGRGFPRFPREDSDRIDTSAEQYNQDRNNNFHPFSRDRRSQASGGLETTHDMNSPDLSAAGPSGSMHPLHHQHNHRFNSHRKMAGRFSDHQRPYSVSNKFTKNQSVQHQHHDVQVRHVRSEEFISRSRSLQQTHPLSDYYAHTIEGEGDVHPEQYSPAPENEFLSYAYQSPLAGYAAHQQQHQHQRADGNGNDRSPANLSESPFSAPMTANTPAGQGLGLNPFAQEFVPSFMLH